MSKEKFVLFTLAGINFTHIMDVMVLMPLGDIFMELFGINPKQFGFLVSSYAIAAFISSLAAMLYLDLFDRKKAMVFLYLGFTISTFLCATANSYLSLLIIRFITGLFGGVIGALALAIISDIFKFEERGKAVGFLMAGFSAAAALGVPVGLILADLFSWRIPFVLVGGIGLILTAVIVLKFPPMTGHLEEIEKDRSIRKVVFSIFSDLNQVNALTLGIVLVLGHFIIIPFITPYMVRNVGFEQSQIFWIYLIGGLFTVFTAPFFGWLTDKMGVLKVFRGVMVLSFIPVILITHIQETAIVWALVVTSLFFILGSGRMIPPQTLITGAVGPGSRGSFMSVKSALQQLGVALASGLSGFIIVFDDAGKLQNYTIVGYLSIFVSIIAILLAPRIRVVAGN